MIIFYLNMETKFEKFTQSVVIILEFLTCCFLSVKIGNVLGGNFISGIVVFLAFQTLHAVVAISGIEILDPMKLDDSELIEKLNSNAIWWFCFNSACIILLSYL